MPIDLRVAALLSLSLVACRGCAPPVELDQLDEELPTAVCAKIYECCSSEEVAASDRVSFEGEQQCVTTYQASLAAVLVPGIEESREQGRVEYDADAAGRCIRRLDRTDCAEFGERFGAGRICDEMTIPLVETGGTCGWNYECVAGTCVIEDFETETGTCRVLPVGGEPCFERARPDGESDRLCATGFECVEGTCAARMEGAGGCNFL